MPLAQLPLPPVIRAAAELAVTVHENRPEDHSEVWLAQTDVLAEPPSPEAILAWDTAMGRIVSSANRVKRALGATGELVPSRRAIVGGDPPAWPQFHYRFDDVDHPRLVRLTMRPGPGRRSGVFVNSQLG